MKPFDNVVFCDNHLFVACKKGGWLTQPDGTSTPDLETAAKEWVKQTYKKNGSVFLHAIHRLDRPVSGLVLFARTSKALSRLNEQSRENKISRLYEAEVEGILKEDSGILEHWLIHGDHRALIARRTDPEAKLARLHYSVEKRTATSTRVFIELETGRYHQIRAQFAAIGHPIAKDGKYGSKHPADCISLHCRKISFFHPISQERIEFSSPAPF